VKKMKEEAKGRDEEKKLRGGSWYMWICPSCGKRVIRDYFIGASDYWLSLFLLCCSEECRENFLKQEQ
jgi:hypothetical protein